MKKIILALILLAVGSTLFAADEQADAVYINMVKEYTMHEDGRITYHHSQQLQLLTYFAFNRRYGESFVVFDTSFQKLTVLRNTTTMADGKKVNAPDNAFNLVLPRFARNAEAYNHLREMVITHIGLERQAIIDLEYSLESATDFLPGLMGDEVLAKDSPIRKLSFRIKIPANMELHFHLFNSVSKPEIKTENGQKIFEWVFENVPVNPHESSQPSSGDFLPRLQFSTLETISQAVEPLFERFDSPHSNLKINLKGQSELEQVLNLQKQIVQEMAVFPIPLADVGYRFKSPAKVWQSNGGTPLEKALLMAAILNESGIEATPLLVNPGLLIDERVPCLEPFTKAAVCVHLKDGPSFLLASDELNANDLRYHLNGKQAIAFTTDKLKLVNLPKATSSENFSNLDMNITLDPQDSLHGEFNLNLGGAATPYLGYQRNQNPADFIIKKIVPNAELSRIETVAADKIQLQASFKNYGPSRVQKEYLFYGLPKNSFGINSLHLPELTKTHVSPLALPFENFTEKNNYKLTIPKGYAVVNPHLNLEKENSVGHLQISYTTKGRELHIERSLRLKKKQIEPAEYNQYFEIMQLWTETKYSEMILRKE